MHGIITLRHLALASLCLLVMFDSLGQLAPTVVPEFKQFELGSLHTYTYASEVLLNEAKAITGTAKDVGFQISSDLHVASVWQNPADEAEKLLQLTLDTPLLHIKSRKAPAPDGFVIHKSQLETIENSPFLVHWKSGNVEEILVNEKEDRSMINMKKGIASLFQFKTFDIETKETDVSGHCNVHYRTIDGHSFIKSKAKCLPMKGLPNIKHPAKIFSTLITDERQSNYTLKHDLSVLESVETHEYHDLTVALRREAGNSVQAKQTLKLADVAGTAKPLKANSVTVAIKQLANNLGVSFKHHDLLLEQEPVMCQDECPTFSKIVKENKEQLKDSNLGTIKSAMTFARLLKVARRTKKEEFLSVLTNPTNKDIMPQLIDIVGATQTMASHGAAMKVLNLKDTKNIDLEEKYLWSLSFGSHPQETVIRDVLNRSIAGVPSEPLSETLTLTTAAMTNKWLQLPGNAKKTLKEDVKNSIVKRLSKCKDDEDCKRLYIRAMKNLRLPDCIPILLKHAEKGDKKTSVEAMAAIFAFPQTYWNDSVRATARRVFLQLGQQYDSSARTLAADILLESNPSAEELYEMIESLRHAATREAQEVGKYTLQRLQQLSESNPQLRDTFKTVLLGQDRRLHGYHVLAQRGLSSAFTRRFLNTASSNGTLVSTLELASGILKRSVLDIVLEGANASEAIFSLGMFAGGLSSYVSSDDPNAATLDDGVDPTAGMELAILGVSLRPFVFFVGQTELMGHVWSGAGSERTPAFQALLSLHNHAQFIPLQNGFMAELSLVGALSFELAGMVQLSLWNRNAHSVVEKNAGLGLLGVTRVDTSFVRSHVEFTIATEQQLSLNSDVNFYSNVLLCMQLTQPDSIVKHNIHKVERIAGSKHKLRKSKYKVYHVPGKTYALNQKNNEMCNALADQE